MERYESDIYLTDGAFQPERREVNTFKYNESAENSLFLLLYSHIAVLRRRCVADAAYYVIEALGVKKSADLALFSLLF